MTASRLSAQAERITTDSLIRSATAAFLGVPESGVGFFSGGNSFDVVVYTTGDRSLVDQTAWAAFTRRTFPVWARAFLFVAPPEANDAAFLDRVARRVSAAANETNSTCDEAAFALGGAQAVADLAFGEQRSR